MLDQQTIDKIIKILNSQGIAIEWAEKLANEILNFLVEQNEEEKCPICDTYKIEICGCNNHLLDY